MEKLFKLLKKLWVDLLTGPDCVTYDFVRVTTAVAFVSGLALQVLVVLKGAEFDFIKFGTGLGLIIAAGAGGMWARKDVELPPEHHV